MFSRLAFKFIPLALLSVSLNVPVASFACSSCGCTISSDWAAQGYTAHEGFSLDLRYDYFNQTELRAGSGKFDRGSVTFPADQEIQQMTRNRNITATLDYSINANWGVSMVAPYIDRYHTTIVDGDTDVSSSNTKSIGDVRIIGRFQGLEDDHSTGIQLGLKLATGGIHENFIDGPQAGTPLDRGLQPGTGTTDLLVGIYHFGTLNKDWDYFAQAMIQQPMNSSEDFKPGTGLNATVGVRYQLNETITPHIQINSRVEKRESGANADIDNSGATLIFLSPGATVHITKGVDVYAFYQIPIYQRVNGLQLEAKNFVSVGAHFTF